VAHSTNQDSEYAEDVLDLIADFDLGSITDEFSRGSRTANVILKSVDKLTLGLHTFDIGNKGLGLPTKI
jgi:hypothetical protein